MDERDRELFQRIVEHADAAVGYADARGSNWTTMRETVDAVITRVTQIAECARRLSPAAQASVPSVQWPAIRGMRNRVVHEYMDIDIVVLASVVESDLPSLDASIRSVLAPD